MSSKKKNEFELMAREALDAESARITQEKLHLAGCDLVVYRVAGDLDRCVIRVQGGEIRMQSRREFLPTLQLIKPEGGRPDP